MEGRGMRRRGTSRASQTSRVERYLEVFGAVEISGAKWCGKTWTALAHGASVSYVDDDLDLAGPTPRS